MSEEIVCCARTKKVKNNEVINCVTSSDPTNNLRCLKGIVNIS